MEIVGVLRNARRVAKGEDPRAPCLSGDVYGDTKGRFRDGERVTTSTIVSEEGDVFRTRYSVYRVESWAGEETPAFQRRVHDWILACFGAEIGSDKVERNHRFLEEAIELVQANGCTASEAHQLVDYVYGRPVGDPFQEVGGVMNTLAALCTASGLDMTECGDAELARVWTKVEKIRAKQAAKPKHSPLPEQSSYWIKWSGGVCPVPETVNVDVKFSDGDWVSDNAGAFYWDWSMKGTGGATSSRTALQKMRASDGRSVHHHPARHHGYGN